ncbi:hypothetical protein GC170_00195 [bacterium]|nr:hypothetical protein [bacterium]
MNRSELQRLANERIEEARALLIGSHWSGAYYLAGYALECGLKSCVLARVERTGIIFQDKKFAEKCWTHDLSLLIELADLKTVLDAAQSSDPNLYANWMVARAWTESTRYKITIETEARELVQAISDANQGVLQWISRYW